MQLFEMSTKRTTIPQATYEELKVQQRHWGSFNCLGCQKMEIKSSRHAEGSKVEWVSAAAENNAWSQNGTTPCLKSWKQVGFTLSRTNSAKENRNCIMVTDQT